MSESPGLRALYLELAESVLQLDEAAIAEEIPWRPSSHLRRDARAFDTAPLAEAENIRQMMLSAVNQHRRGALAAAYANYQREVSRMRTENYQLPPSPESRRRLLAYLFETYPQMERTFLTVQHREFAALSDGDVESFLKQLQELGAYEPRELDKKGAPWNSPEIAEQQPETD